MTPLPSLESILNQRQLPGLDGFRMIAVFSVMFYHAGVEFFFTARHGVAGFFVLSGFLITWLLLREWQKSEHISLRDFYIRRTLRIFPAYYAFVFVTVGWDLYRESDAIKEMIIPSLLYFVNYHNAMEGHSTASVAHLWSLAVEEQFYLIWPILLIILLKLGRTYVVGFLCGAIILVMLWRSLAFSVLEFGQSWAYNAFDTRFDNLAIGCLLAFIVQNHRARIFLQQISAQFWMPLVTLGLLGVSINLDNAHYLYGPAFTIDAFLLAVLLVQLIIQSQGVVFQWLNWRPVVYLGIISYPLYLWHGRGLEVGEKLQMLPEGLQVGVGMIAAILLASTSYHFIEKPCLRMKAKFQNARPSEQKIIAAQPSGTARTERL